MAIKRVSDLPNLSVGLASDDGEDINEAMKNSLFEVSMRDTESGQFKSYSMDGDEVIKTIIYGLQQLMVQGLDPSNIVFTNTAQTITGSKTFSGATTIFEKGSGSTAGSAQFKEDLKIMTLDDGRIVFNYGSSQGERALTHVINSASELITIATAPSSNTRHNASIATEYAIYEFVKQYVANSFTNLASDIEQKNATKAVTGKAVADFCESQGYLAASEFDDPTNDVRRLMGQVNTNNVALYVHKDSSVTANQVLNGSTLTIGSATYELQVKLVSYNNNSYKTVVGVNIANENDIRIIAVKNLYEAISVLQSMKFLQSAAAWIDLLTDNEITPGTQLNLSHPDFVQNKTITIQPAELKDGHTWDNVGYSTATTQRRMIWTNIINNETYLWNYYSTIIQCGAYVTFNNIDFNGNIPVAIMGSSNWTPSPYLTTYFIGISSNGATFNYCKFANMTYALVGQNFTVSDCSFYNVSVCVHSLNGGRITINQVNATLCGRFLVGNTNGTTRIVMYNQGLCRIQTILPPFANSNASMYTFSFYNGVFGSGNVGEDLSKVSLNEGWGYQFQRFTYTKETNGTKIEISNISCAANNNEIHYNDSNKHASTTFKNLFTSIFDMDIDNQGYSIGGYATTDVGDGNTLGDQAMRKFVVLATGVPTSYDNLLGQGASLTGYVQTNISMDRIQLPTTDAYGGGGYAAWYDDIYGKIKDNWSMPM